MKAAEVHIYFFLICCLFLWIICNRGWRDWGWRN